MWLQAKLRAKLLLLGEGRAGRHSPEPFPEQDRAPMDTAIPNEGWQWGMEDPAVAWRFRTSSALPAPLLTLHDPSLSCGETTGLWGQLFVHRGSMGKGAFGVPHLHNPDKWQETGMTLIMGHCASSGGKPFVCKATQWTIRVGVCPAAASYKRPFKLPDFYARSTYTIKLFLKQLNCLQVLCKKPNLFEEKICTWKGNPISTRNSDFSQIKPLHPQKN